MGAADLDAEVAAALAANAPGDAAAAIVRRLGPGLLGYLVAVLRSESDGREVFADVAKELVGSIASFRGESSVKTWVYRIGWRMAMRFREAPERRLVRRLETDEVSALVEEVQASTAEYQKTAAKDWLAGVRAELSAEDQSLLTLRIDRGLSWAEVAQVMGDGGDGTAPARLRKRYERIKDVLRAAAERDGRIGTRDDR